MGLLDVVGGVAASVGKFTMETAEQYIKKNIVDERDARLNEMAAEREKVSAERGEGYKIAGEKRAIENVPLLDAAKLPGQKAAWKAEGEAKLEAYKAQTAYDLDPTNVEAKAKAKVLSDKVVATGAAATTAELLKDPAYLKNVKDLALAQHPEKAAQIAASMSTVALHAIQIREAKALEAARADLAAAKTDDERKAATAKIGALQWSLQAERAQQQADAATLKSLEANIKDARVAAATLGISPEAKAREEEIAARGQRNYDALAAAMLKDRGVTQAPTGLPKPMNQAEFDAIKPGDTYINPRDNKPYVKKAGDKATPAAGGAPGGLLNTTATTPLASPLENARENARTRATEADAASQEEARATARARIEPEVKALNSGAFDVISQANYRKLFMLNASPALTRAEKAKVGALLRKY